MKAEFDRKALIDAILKRDIDQIIILTSDRETKIHQFYTQEDNVWMGEGDAIEYDEEGDFYDSDGNILSFQQFKAFETKSRDRTTKLQILPDLIYLQLCSKERLKEVILEIKENGIN